MTERPTHSFPKWGPRGPFRVYSWAQMAVSGLGVFVAALLLVVGLIPQALVLLGLVAVMLIRIPAGLPLWTHVGAGWLHLIVHLNRDRSNEVDGTVGVSAYRVADRVMGVAGDGRRVVAGMRIRPRFNHWLASNDELEVYADDWSRLVSSIPSTVERIQILTNVHRPRQSRTDPEGGVLSAAESIISAASRRIDTYLIVRLDQSIQSGTDGADRTAYEALQHLGGQLPTELVAAEILSPFDWNELLATCNLDVGSLRFGWDRITDDANRHRVGMWVWDWPQRPTFTGFLAPLLSVDVDATISLTIEPLDPEPRQRALDYAYRRAEAALTTATGGKHRKRADLETLDRKLTELNAGHIPIRALLTIAFEAAAIESLERGIRTVKAKATACHTRADVAAGHQRAFLESTFPLCRGVDRSPL